MKKIYLISGLLFLCFITTWAQNSANRTTATIVADVLAQMPAQEAGQYNNQMKDLVSTGEDGIIQLVKMINPPGKGNNASVEYALSGLSHYVSANGMESSRLVTANAYIKALDMVSERETKAFIIRQLQMAGKDESVAKLASYLGDETLSGPAARALAAINSASSGKALVNALNKVSNDKSEKDIVEAIGEMQPVDAEKALKPLLGSGNADMQKTILYALSRVGTKASLPELAAAAEKVNFTMEKTGANEAYIMLIKRVLALGDAKEAEKAADDLMKKSQKAGKIQTRESALQILMAAQPGNAFRLVETALNDPSSDYRNYALASVMDYTNNDMMSELLNSLKKANPEVKADLLNWFIQVCEIPQNRAYLASKGTDIFIERLSDNDIQIKKASAEILAKLAGSRAILFLANQLGSPDIQTVEIVKDALNFTKGDIAVAVAPVISTAPDAGKIAGLQLLGNRKASAYLNTVLEQINSGSPAVKETAYSVLKNVVTSENLNTLYPLLEKAQEGEIKPVQDAVIASLKSYPGEKQFEIISGQINKTDKSKQYLYYPVLATTGSNKALDVIVGSFKNESGKSKDAAFQALLDWKGREVADELYAISKDLSAISYSERALNRYIKLASGSELTGENRRIFLANALEIAKTDAQKNEILRQIGQTGSFLGMLLAGEYLNQPAMQQSAAGAVMNIALNNKGYTGKNVERLLNKVIEVLNNPDAEYQKEAIRKHLKEMPKEEGFVSIFNGKDLTGWQGLVENPISRMKMKPAELAKKQAIANEIARKHWTAKDGVLIFDGEKGGDNLCTIKKYGDFEMYVDWNLDKAGPEADAGIYLRGTPQVQMWDTARTNVGAQVGSGGLYNNQKNPSKPLKVADNKLGEWNNLYIKMTGERVTVMLNGELVVDNVILENFWDRTQPIFPMEQIELQAHGSKVYYRNIYVKELEHPKYFELSAEEKKEGYKVLFDGTNMNQWTGNTTDYIVEDGNISLVPRSAHGGNLYTKDEYANFIFRFEFQLTPAANNGLGIRTPMKGDAAYVGMELQILDNEAPEFSRLKPYQYHGSVYGIMPAKRGFLKPTGEWNYQEVIANGDNIKVILNGTVILDGNLREVTKNGMPDNQQHPGLFNKKGHIAFLGHGSPVKFRNIRIKEL